MTLHPHAVGFGHRIGLLDAFLSEMRRFPGLWNATGAEVAAYWRQRFPPDTHLRLQDSIWRDYPGVVPHH